MPPDDALSSARARARAMSEANKNPPPSRYLRYTGHVRTGDFRHGLLLRRGGGLLAVWKLRGVPAELWSDDEHWDAREALNRRVQAMQGGKRLIAVHEIKTWADEGEYPRGECRTPFAREVDERYRAALFGLPDPYGGPPPALLRHAPHGQRPRLMRIDLYVSAYLRPGAAPGSKFGKEKLRDWKRRFGEWRERTKVRASVREDRLREMEAFAGQVEANLAAYGPERCGVYEDPGSGMLFSEVYEALHHILYGERRRIGLSRGKAEYAIHGQRIVAPGSTIHVRRAGGDRFGRMFTLNHYNVSATPKMFREVQEAAYPYTMTNVFAFWERRDADVRMGLKRNQFLVSGDPAVGQKDKLAKARERLQDREFSAGSHHFSFACYAEDAGGQHRHDPARLRHINRTADRAYHDLGNAGLHPFLEDLTLEACVYAQLPDNEDLQPCPGLATTLNFASWARLHRHPTGMARGPWGPAMLPLLTRAWTGFNLHLQAPKAIDAEGDLGNTLVVGPAGSGKTVLLAMLVAMAEKFGADVVVYDKDRGLEILTRFLGGDHLRLRAGSPTGMNPLRGCGHEDIEFLTRWYLGLRSYSRKEPPTERDEHLLRLGLKEMLDLEPGFRSNRELRAHLGADGGWLDLWIGEGERTGPYGWAFDGPEDRIMQRHRLACRDMTDLAELPHVCDPAVAYMAYADRKRLDGERKLLLVMDEVWKALTRAAFGAQVKDLLKTIRKLMGLVVLATQDVTDFLSSDIASAIMHESPTRIWMADPRASEEKHRAAGLTEQMWRAVKTGGVSDHAFLVEQQVDHVVCRMPLPPDLLAVMSGNAPRILLMERLMRRHGEDVALWGPHYRRLWHTAKAADA